MKDVLSGYQSVLNGVGVHPQWGKYVFQAVHVGAGTSEEGERGVRCLATAGI